MALGMITPGRLGELARIQRVKHPKRCAGLFFLEKAIEVGCLIAICLVAVVILNFLAWWVPILLAEFSIICVIAWRKIMIFSVHLLGKRFGWPSPDMLEKIEWAISNLKISGCILLSFACFLIFIMQIYIILLSMGTIGDPRIIPLIPLVLLINLVPITIGGYGVRETAAVFLFKLKYIKEAVAASSVGLASFFNLVIPGFVGVGFYLYRSKEGLIHLHSYSNT